MRGGGDAGPYGRECPAQNRNRLGKGTAARAGHAPPLRNKQRSSQTGNPAANKRPAREGGRGFKWKKPDFVSKIV